MLRSLLILVVASVLGLLTVNLLPIEADEFWVDPISGSTKTQTRGLLGCRNQVVDSSPLEHWLAAREGTYQPAWKRISSGPRNAIGQVLSRRCSLAPPIFKIRPRLADYVRTATDPEIREFVRIMRESPSSEKERAADEVCSVTIEANARALTR